MSTPGGEPASRRPEDSDFKQQRLPVWQPILTPHWVISCFVFVGAVFIPLGALVLVASDDCIEVEIRYDDKFKDCHWSYGAKGTGGDACLAKPGDATCGTDCSDPNKCGMLAALPAECPRDFSTVKGGGEGFNWSKTKWGDLSDVRTMGAATDRAFGETCDPRCTKTIEFEVKETMKAPVYMYYRLTAFHQNHRIYAMSREDKQLAGAVSTGDEDCKPLLSPGGLSGDGWCDKNFGSSCSGVRLVKQNAWTGNTEGTSSAKSFAVGDFTYNSCGLVAWSMFNDSLSVFGPVSGTSAPLVCAGDNFSTSDSKCLDCGSCTKYDISYPADRSNKYKEPKLGADTFSFKGFRTAMDKCKASGCDYWPEPQMPSVVPFLYNGWYFFEPYHRVPNPVDEDFMIWMRTQTLPTFRKLYRTINVDLAPGKYQLRVDHRFDTSMFSGEKYAVLSQLSWIGGKNHILGMLYIIVGVLCVLTALVFAGKHMSSK